MAPAPPLAADIHTEAELNRGNAGSLEKPMVPSDPLESAAVHDGDRGAGVDADVRGDGACDVGAERRTKRRLVPFVDREVDVRYRPSFVQTRLHHVVI